MTMNNIRLPIFAIIAIVLATPCNGLCETHDKTVLVESFESDFSADRWTFSNGPEFPGAEGNFARSATNGRKSEYCGALSFNFEDGGNYVSATVDVSAQTSNTNGSGFAGLRLDIKRPVGNSVVFRYTDQTGQVLQKRVECTAGTWTSVTVPFSHWQNHWGGENDGRVHGAPKQLGILIENGEQKKGELLFDNLRLIAGSTEDLFVHVSYTPYTFDGSEEWRLTSKGDRGKSHFKEQKWHLDFTSGADWLGLRVPDRVLLGNVERIRLRVRGSAKGHPVHIYLRTHFMTFHKTIGEFSADGVQELVTEGPPGNGWKWYGGENDGKLHGPLRFAEIRIERNGKFDQCELKMEEVSLDVNCLPQKRCVMTGEVKELSGESHFVATIRALSEKPLHGEIHWTLRNWDQQTVENGNERIILLPSAKPTEVLVPLPSVDNNTNFVEADFRLDVPGQDVPNVQPCWMRPHEAHGDSKIVPDSPFGMGLYLYRYGSDPEGLAEMERAAQMARDAGVKWSREEFAWARIEPKEGEYNWDFYDHVVECAKRNGIQVYAIVAYWTYWTEQYTDKGIADYVNYVRALVNRYRDDIHQWEIWNEPNIFFWQGPKDKYAELLIQSYAAIKEIDPSAEVLGISTAGIDTEFIERMLDLNTPFDVLTIHPYRKTLDDLGFIKELRNVSDLVKKADGTRRPVWITEMGWPTYTPHNALDQSFRPTSLRNQAELIARTYLCSIVSGIEPRTFWYNFRNDGYDPIYFEHNMGIVTRDFQPKPAYHTYSVLAKVLKRKKLDRRVELPGGVLAFRFLAEEAGENDVIALWHPKENAVVSLPIDADRVTILNAVGESKERAVKNGTVEITLREGAAVYVSVP